MSERDFKIGEQEFKLNKVDVFKQYNIVRRLGPLLSDLIPIAGKVSELQKSSSGEQNLDQLAVVAEPILNGLSKLSDADSNFVLMGLLESVEMKQKEFNSWARVVKNGNVMIDMDLPMMLQIAGRAFMFNMSGFFASMSQASLGQR